MTIEQIFHIVCDLVRRHGTRDPMRILKERGILTLFQDMGTRPDSCKGFYLHQDRIGCVTINSALGVDMQRIIAAHGGDITVESQVGRGTTFRIDLPAYTVGEAPAPGSMAA